MTTTANIHIDLRMNGNVEIRSYVWNGKDIIGSQTFEQDSLFMMSVLLENRLKRAVRYIRALNPAILITFSLDDEAAAAFHKADLLDDVQQAISFAKRVAD